MLESSESGPLTVATPTESEVRKQFDRIRSSPEFHASERATAFISYIIEETLAGRGCRLKAYTIALEVFGRESSFDAQNDPVVRIEAARMRRTLERYYLVAGQGDPVIITIPKGGYAATFRCTSDQTSSSSDPITDSGSAALSSPGMSLGYIGRAFSWLGDNRKRRTAVIFVLSFLVFAYLLSQVGLKTVAPIRAEGDLGVIDMPTLVVMPFEDLTGSDQASVLARGLTDEVIGQLSKFKEITVIAGGSRDHIDPGVRTAPKYALEGRVRLDGDTLRFTTRFISKSDGSVIWSNNYDHQINMEQLLEVESNIARNVATTLAQPYGIIFQNEGPRINALLPDDWNSYACTLAYYRYRAELDPKNHASVQDCLLRATASFPSYSTFWALLSLTYLDEVRFRYRLQNPRPTSDALHQAVATAQRAVELDPQNVRALQSRMLAYFFSGEIDAALSTGSQALAINSNDPELSGEYGFRLALSGKWATGCELMSGAVAQMNGPQGYYEVGLAMCAYMRQDYEAAELWARMADLRYNSVNHLVLLGVLGARGKIADAQKERQWLETNSPDLLKSIRKEVAARLPRVEDQERFFAGLRAAGLQIPPG